MMNATGLTNTEQRGTISFVDIDGQQKTRHGWFYIKHGDVIMRELDGDTRFTLARLVRVVQFTADKDK